MIVLRTLGGLDVRDAGGEPVREVLAHPKRAGLLIYLGMAARAGYVRRPVLHGLFWPESPEERAKASLKQELYQLRQNLGRDLLTTRGEEEVGLDLSLVSIDVADFEAAVGAGEFGQATEVYGGPFLDGFAVGGCLEFEQWVDREREHLAVAHRRVLERLVAQAVMSGKTTEVGRWARELGASDPYSTRTALRVMEALVALGDRAGALQYADAHARRLREDLDAEPSPDVVALATRLRERPVRRIESGAGVLEQTGQLARGAQPEDALTGRQVGERAAHRVGPATVDQVDVVKLDTDLGDRYRIERELGSGGMATVYLAEDVKHDRKVAVKVLRPELAAVLGADRFVHEIKTTASLQHPNILPLHDSGEAGGFLYYVMPYVDGETLRAKLTREKQLGIEEAIEIATDVADALDYAHRQGVIHRDIKPENILLHDGRPMVADFGIALAVSAAAGGRLTETGFSLGTPQYMSPEQATAEKDLTGRSDIYSLGAVLYETLTGEPPHAGNSTQQIVMRIVTEVPPPVTALRKSTPPNVTAAVAKALEKLPADRFATAARFGEALRDPRFGVTESETVGVSGPAGDSARLLRWAWPAISAFLAAVALWGWLRPAPPVTVARWRLTFPQQQELLSGQSRTFDGLQVQGLAFGLAPDGSWIVYDGPAEAGSQLWIKPRNAADATPIAGTEKVGAGSAPAVSPDGEWIVFWSAGELRKVRKGGGSSIAVVDSVSSFARGVAWLDDGTIVYQDIERRLRRVSEEGGGDTVIWSSPEGADLSPRFPAALPGARGILFNVCKGVICNEHATWVLDLHSGDARELLTGTAQAWYAGSGHVVYVLPDGGVSAVRFDLPTLSVTGPHVPVLEGVQIWTGDGRTLHPQMTLAPSGTLLMIAGSSIPAAVPVEPVWVTREGTVTAVDPGWTLIPSPTPGWALSPDGRRLAISVGSVPEIWIKELDSGPVLRLTTDESLALYPHWAPGGRSVLFVSDRAGNLDLYVQRADQTQPVELLVDLDEVIYEAVLSPGQDWVIFRTGGGREQRDIWAKRMDRDDPPAKLLDSQFDEVGIALSRDGRWMAYQSDETGRWEVYLRPFPDVGADVLPVSVGGGATPRWAHSGRELFYVNAQNQMITARVRTEGSEVTVEGREVLFSVDGLRTSPFAAFDVAPDDQRFLMMRDAAGGSPGSADLIVVENWLEELKRLVPR